MPGDVVVTRYALIEGDLVVNVIAWDGETAWTAPDGCDVLPLDDDQPVSPGDIYDGSTFTPAVPAPVVDAVPVTVDPQVLTDLLTQAQKATTVTATRNVLAALLQQLQPDAS